MLRLPQLAPKTYSLSNPFGDCQKLEITLKPSIAQGATADTTTPRFAPPVHGVMASLAMAMLLSSLGTSIANVGLPTLAHAFHASFQQVQWVVLAYLLAITTLIVGVGRLGDLIGRRRLLLAGVSLFTLASLLCGLAPNLGTLIAARALQGLGAASMMALAMAFVGDAVPKARTGSAMGLLGTMSAVGTALGPSLGGMLIAGWGWQALFFVNVPLGLLAGLLAWRYLPRDRQGLAAGQEHFDLQGTALLALTLAAYALAVTVGGGRFSSLNVVLGLAALLGGGVFILAQTRRTSPLIRLAAFRDPGLSTSLVMNLLVSTVMMATLVVGPFYLAQGLGLSAVWVGMVMAAGPVVSALSGVPAGRLVDRWGAPRMVTAGLVAAATGALALSILPGIWGVTGYVAALVMLTPGYQLFQAGNNTAVMASTDASERGVISGLLALSRNLGLITGASAIGALFALATGTDQLATASAAEVTHAMQITFGITAVLIAAAIVLALASPRLAQRKPL